MNDSTNSSLDSLNSLTSISDSLHQKNVHEELRSDNMSPVNITHSLASPNSTVTLQTTLVKPTTNFRLLILKYSYLKYLSSYYS